MEADDLKNLADAQFARTTFLNNLKETYDAKLTVAHRGGTFLAKPELIWGRAEGSNRAEERRDLCRREPHRA